MRFKIGGNCIVNPAANEIIIKKTLKSQRIKKIEPRIMQVLILLAEQPGAVLSRDFLIETVWENKFVGEEALTQAISRLRKVLGDKPHKPQFIQTIPKNGYRIIANIQRNDEINITTFTGRPIASHRRRSLRVSTFSSVALAALVFFIAIYVVHHF